MSAKVKRATIQTDRERIAIVETSLADFREWMDERFAQVGQQVATVGRQSTEQHAALSKEVKELKLAHENTDGRLKRYESRWGMLVMLGSAVVALLSIFRNWIAAHLSLR